VEVLCTGGDGPRTSRLASADSAAASSALSYANCLSLSAELELSSLFLLRRWKMVIHLSLSLSFMTRNRTHSDEESSSGSMCRIRSWLAARCRRAIDKGRFVSASTCNAPKPPLRMCGVLYMAGRATRLLDGMVGEDVSIERWD